MQSEAFKTSQISRDEMNLAEFPLTVLSTRVSPKIKTLEFKDSVVGKSGKIQERRWIITAADKFGLPTASDDEVLLGLLKLSVESGLKDSKVFFTRYELLRVLRWTTEGRSYQRLSQALDRLSGVRIKATNSFFDNESKTYSTKNFGILDAYEINNGRDPDTKPSFFIWSEVLFKSFQVGFIKKIDLDFFLSLSSAVTKRLYRYLDKHFWYKSRVRINLFTLAHEKIGISRNYRYPSSIRQQLDPALDELCKLNFLSGYEYIGRGKGTEVIISAAKAKPRKLLETRLEQDQSFPNELSQRLVEELEARGIAATQACKLIQGRNEKDLARALKIVSHFDLLISSNSQRVSRNPVGFLYRAIQRLDSYVLPEDQVQGSLDLKGRGSDRRPSHSKSRGASPTAIAKEDSRKEAKYLEFRRKELESARQSVEPELYRKLEDEVNAAFENVSHLISRDGLERAKKHALDEKLCKLLAIPAIEEWTE